ICSKNGLSSPLTTMARVLSWPSAGWATRTMRAAAIDPQNAVMVSLPCEWHGAKTETPGVGGRRTASIPPPSLAKLSVDGKTRDGEAAAVSAAAAGRSRAMTILECRGLTKHFGAIHALDDVSLAVSAGEVVGLMGDNGAGKSTLVKIVAGNFPPSAGTLLIDGRPASFARPSAARQSGIEVVYQDLALCDNLPA